MDFGFSLSPSSAIELDTLDTSLFRKLCRIEPGARTCIACGSCSATCTAAVAAGQESRSGADALQLHALREMHDGLSARHQYAAGDPDRVPLV